ncbi:MAG: Hpt domain-containing protein, partial [Acetobacteraceae bacterium]|nr:Hpt domain-containing protein [Acetobacteraceae bacterium]
MEAIRQTFFQECEEQLAELESGLMAMDAGQVDTDTINAVFRAVHSIKGGAGAFGLEELVRFAHVFETALDEVRAGRLALTNEMLAVMLRSADALADLVRAARNGGTADTAKCSELATALRQFSASEASAPDEDSADDGEMEGIDFQPLQVMSLDLAGETKQPKAWQITFKPHPAMYAKANETGLLLRELKRLGSMSVQLDASALPPLGDLDPDGAYLSW